MNITRDDLTWAMSQGVLRPEQVDELWQALEAKTAHRARLDVPHVVYYLGGAVILVAMSIFGGLTWMQFGESALAIVATIYALFFVQIGVVLDRQPDLHVPSGILITLAVCIVPLIIYGILKWQGLWPTEPQYANSAQYIAAYHAYNVRITLLQLLMELSLILASSIALVFFAFSLLVVPLLVGSYSAVWTILALLTLDGSPYINAQWLNLAFGGLVVLVAYMIDQRTQADYAFWAYLGGLPIFTLGLPFFWNDRNPELHAVFALFCIVFILLSVVLERWIFLIVGSIGLFAYVIELAGSLFTNSYLYPFALSLIGVGLIGGGIVYQRNRQRIGNALRSQLPADLLWLLPRERRAYRRGSDL